VTFWLSLTTIVSSEESGLSPEQETQLGEIKERVETVSHINHLKWGIPINVYEIAKEKIDEAKRLLKQGNELYRKGQYEGAIAYYDRVIGINRKMHEAWYKKGCSLNNLKRYSEALASYDEAKGIKPDDYYTWYKRGRALEKLEQYSEALASYDKAIEIKRDDYDAWFNRGNVLEKLQRYSEALASYMTKPLKSSETTMKLGVSEAMRYGNWNDTKRRSHHMIKR